jgi:NAD(P)-dependent dehydrogenase (short-subunit alcohol dehydrogenase family)
LPILAAEFGPDGVGVNAIQPIARETEMYYRTNGDAEKQAFVIGLHALQRFARSEELARACAPIDNDPCPAADDGAGLLDILGRWTKDRQTQ